MTFAKYGENKNLKGPISLPKTVKLFLSMFTFSFLSSSNKKKKKKTAILTKTCIQDIPDKGL